MEHLSIVAQEYVRKHMEYWRKLRNGKEYGGMLNST